MAFQLTIQSSKPEYVRDNRNRVLYKLNTLPSGKIEVKDKTGALKFTFDPKLLETRDTAGRLISKGRMVLI